MTTCKNCGKEVKQTEGKRPRLFCPQPSNCRIVFWKKNKGTTQKPKDEEIADLKNELENTKNLLILEQVERNKAEEALKFILERHMVTNGVHPRLVPLKKQGAKKGLNNLTAASPKTNFQINTTDGQDAEMKVDFKFLSVDKYDGQKLSSAIQDEVGQWAVPKFDIESAKVRIADLENELKTPPKNPMIGLKAWRRLRENELNGLKSML